MDAIADFAFTKSVIGRLDLKNRLALAPMTRVSASQSGHATERMARYYERFAHGGFGLIITEGIYTDQSFSQGYFNQPGISDDEQAKAWRTVTGAIHRHGGAVFAQLMHAGALSQGNRFVNHTVAPSAIRPRGEQLAFYHGQGQYPLPKAMTDVEITGAIDGFAKAAHRAVSVAGFDGIEIHAANGYLLDQFLTDYTNQRNDSWGGDIKARMGLTLAVVDAVKRAVGHSVPVGVRISQGKVNDFTHKWPEGESAAQIIFGALSEAGVDFIHVTEHKSWESAFNSGTDSLVSMASRFAPNVALIANGGINDNETLERVFDQGADFVALGKAALSNPNFPKRLLKKREIATFNPALLGPIANIKDCEIMLEDNT